MTDDSGTNQGERTMPEQAEANLGQQDKIADDSGPDDTGADDERTRARGQHLANKERGGSIAGGGSRDE